MRKINELLGKIAKPKDNEPQPDLAECEDCKWSGDISECVKGEDGDWESGYYEIDECPKCGGVVNYDMSAEVGNKWNEWYENKMEWDYMLKA